MLGVTHGSGFMSGADRQRFRIIVSSPTLDFVLTDRLNALGWDGREVDVDILVATNEGDLYPLGVPDPTNDLWETYSGAWIGSSSTSTAALLLDTLPLGSAVTVDNRGFICGRGGDGGAGGIPGVNSGLGGNGGNGGPAIEVDSANWYSVTIVNRGFIGGGGGGGGGGSTYNADTDRGAGGGPGGGLPAGAVGTTTNRSDYFNGYRRGSFPYGGCGGGLRSEPGATALWAQSSSGGNGGAVGEDGVDQSASPASVANPGQGLGGTAGAAIIDPNDQVTIMTPGNIPGTGGIVWGPGTPPDPSNYVWGSTVPVCQVRGPGLPFAYDGDVQVVMGNGELKKMKDLVVGDEVATFTPTVIYAALGGGTNIMDEDNPVYYNVPYSNVGDILGVDPNEYLGLFRSKATVVGNQPYTLTTQLDRFDVKGTESETFTSPLSGALLSWHGRVFCGDTGSPWNFSNTSYPNKRILFRSRTGVFHPDTGAQIVPNATHPALNPGERRFDRWLLGSCAPTASGAYTVYSPILGASSAGSNISISDSNLFGSVVFINNSTFATVRTVDLDGFLGGYVSLSGAVANTGTNREGTWEISVQLQSGGAETTIGTGSWTTIEESEGSGVWVSNGIYVEYRTLPVTGSVRFRLKMKSHIGTYGIAASLYGDAAPAVIAPGLVMAAAFTVSTSSGTEERSMLVLARGNKVIPSQIPPSPSVDTGWPEWKAGTMFLMADGTTKDVASLVPGDLLRCVSGHPVLHGKLKRSDFYDLLGGGRFNGYAVGTFGVPSWKRSQSTVTTSTVRVKSCVPARVITAPFPAQGSVPASWDLLSQNSDELFYNPNRTMFVTMRGGSGPAGIFTPTDSFIIEPIYRTLDAFPGNLWYGKGWVPGGGTGVAMVRHRSAGPYAPIFSNSTNTASYCSAFTTAQDADAAGQTYFLEIEETGPTSCAVLIANGYYVVNVRNDSMLVI